MKSYIIDQIMGSKVSMIATSIDDLESKALEYCDKHIGGCTKIYVHCSHVYSNRRKNCGVAYMTYINNQKMTITTRRIR